MVLKGLKTYGNEYDAVNHEIVFSPLELE